MNDESGPPLSSPEDDLELDRSLEALPRFRPLPDFADRVLARVWVPLPRWARRVRNWFRGLVSGTRGWVTLTAFSVATAATWFIVIGLTIDQWDRIAWGSRFVLQPMGLENWQDVWARGSAYLDAARSGAAQAVDALPILLAGVLGGYAILTLVCAVALKRLVTAPAGMRVSR